MENLNDRLRELGFNDLDPLLTDIDFELSTFHENFPLNFVFRVSISSSGNALNDRDSYFDVLYASGGLQERLIHIGWFLIWNVSDERDFINSSINSG